MNSQSVHNVISVRGLSKRYGGVKALNGLDLDLAANKVHAIVGENGAGKSTLMKILTTYLTADDGSAKVNGFDVSSQQKDVQLSIGYLPEHNPLYLEMFVKEYLLFNASIYKISK